MNVMRGLALLLVLAALPGCVFASVTSPLDVDLHETRLGTRVGESSYRSILGLVAWGDAGAQAAAEQGGVTTLRHMDKHQFWILFGLYYRYTTIVYGD